MREVNITISAQTLTRAYAMLIALGAILFFGMFAHAATPNPGHPWTDIGNGTWQVANTQTSARSFTFPDQDATALTTAGAPLSGTIPYGNGTGVLATTSAGSGGQVLALSNGVPTWISTTTLATISGTLGLTGGGTGASLAASTGGILYSGASAFAVLAGTATAGQILQSGASAAPIWSTATYPAAAGTSGNALISNGTNFVSTAANDRVVFTNVGLYPANLTSVTALTTGTTYFEYLGVADKAYTSCTILQNVSTAAVTITWAEVALFKGTPPLNGTASLTRIGSASVSATYNSTGRKSTAISSITVARGDPLWVAFGASATTPFQVRGLLADDLQSGVFQTGAVQPSAASSPFTTTLGTATAVPAWIAMKCT